MLAYTNIKEFSEADMEDQNDEFENNFEIDEDMESLRLNRGQARNITAVNVLKQIKLKLEGRDSSDKPRLSVSDQVSNLIAQATDVDRLSLMYEGWTGWI